MNIKQQVYGLGKKIVDAGGNYIANRVMIQPEMDRMRGERADEKRQAIVQRRESIKGRKEMGY